MLKITNVSKRIGGQQILTPISLSLPPHKTHVLIGSSGSGKTTLLRIILGIETADTGTVELAGTLLSPQSQREWTRSIGYVPQEGGLFPHLTAARNVSLVARTLHWPRSKIRARLEELWKIAGLETDLFDRLPKELSGGQQQRVAIARAAFLDPKIMLLDEPLGALDPLLRAEMQDQLKGIFNRLGKTVVLVTHDMAEAAFFGHSITLLHEGSVVQSGTIADFLERPAAPFVTKFLQAQRTLYGSAAES